jgi:hypothetical protein
MASYPVPSLPVFSERTRLQKSKDVFRFLLVSNDDPIQSYRLTLTLLL